jgi:hypothetical protein
MRAPYFLRVRSLSEDLFFIHSTTRSKESLPAVVQANGAVFSVGESAIVALGMPKVRRITSLPEKLQEAQSLQLAEDGTVLNLFVRAGEVFCTTSRRPDGKEARWSSDRSFYDLFLDAVGGDVAVVQEALKPGFTYSFVLRHPANTIVIPHLSPSVVHVATRCMETFRECDEATPQWAVGPRWLTLEEAAEVIKKDEELGAISVRGVILVDRSDATVVRRSILDSPLYRELSRLRKNKKHLHVSYLAGSEEDRSMLRRSYPDAWGLFDHLDAMLGVLAGQIHEVYLQIHVRKSTQPIPDHPFDPFLRACHTKYLRHRVPIDFNLCHALVRKFQWRHLDKALVHLSRAVPK